MRQQGTHTITIRVCSELRLAFLLAVACSGLVGCALPEHIEQSKCRIPPHYPHEFEAPTSWGYFKNRWRAWPGAEAVPGYTMMRKKPGDETQEEVGAGGSSETLPPPDSEGSALPETNPDDPFARPMEEENRGNEGDMFNEGNNAVPELPAMPDASRPEDLIPPRSAPPENEPLPDANAPPPTENSDAFAVPPANDGAWNLESLPSEAPEGSLIPDEQEMARRTPPPGLLVPVKEMGRNGRQAMPPVQNVKRPSPVRGASATERLRDKNIRSSSLNNVRRAANAGEAFGDGPQLVSPDLDSRGTAAAAVQANAEQTNASQRDAAAQDTSSAASADPSAALPEWHANPVRGGAVARPTAQAATSQRTDGWQRRNVRPEYPEVQTSHTVPAPAKSVRPVEYTAGSSANPLR